MYYFTSNSEEDKGLTVSIDNTGGWSIYRGDVELGHSWISFGYDHTRRSALAIAMNVFRTQRKVRADHSVSTKETTDD